MRPILVRVITGATAGVTVNLGFRPQYVKVINTGSGATAEAIRGMAAASAALNVIASGGGTDTGGANRATTAGLTLGGQSVTIGSNALPNAAAGIMIVFG